MVGFGLAFGFAPTASVVSTMFLRVFCLVLGAFSLALPAQSVHPTDYGRIGIGIRILNIGDIQYNTGAFDGDILIAVRRETGYDGKYKRYPASAIKSMVENKKFDSYYNSKQVQTCRDTGFNMSSPLYVPGNGVDNKFGIFFSNIVKKSFFHLIGRNDQENIIRVQGNFITRNRIDLWPFNKETFEFIMSFESDLQENGDITDIFCNLEPEFTGISDSFMFPGNVESFNFEYAVRMDAECAPPYRYSFPNTNDNYFSERLKASCPDSPDASFQAAKTGAFEYDHTSCKCLGGQTAYMKYRFELYKTPAFFPAFFRMALAPYILVVILSFTYVLQTAHLLNRLVVVNGALLSMVVFHINLRRAIPAGAGITIADEFMGLQYVIALVAIGTTGRLIAIHYAKSEKEKMKETKSQYVPPLHRIMLFVAPPSYIGMEVIYFFSRVLSAHEGVYNSWLPTMIWFIVLLVFDAIVVSICLLQYHKKMGDLPVIGWNFASFYKDVDQLLLKVSDTPSDATSVALEMVGTNEPKKLNSWAKPSKHAK